MRLFLARKSLLWWVAPLILLVLVASCGGDVTPTPTRTPGNTLILAYDGWTGTYLPAYVLKVIFEEELGYDVRVSDQSTIPAAFESVATGRTDMFTSAWFPAGDSNLDKYPNLVKLGQVYGGKDRDAFEGWMVSADFARQNGLSHVRDLSDPVVARALDTDGDGKGNLIGSPEDHVAAGRYLEIPSDYGVAGRHPEILTDYGLSGLYDVDVPASEQELLLSIESRLRSGKPTLFYMYQPVGFPEDLLTEERFTWLQGTQAYLPLAFNRTVVRSEFIANSPEAAKVLSVFRIPGKDIGQSMGRIADKGDSPETLEELARTWIGENRAEVDKWLEGIPARTPPTDLPSETLTVAYTSEIEDLILKLAIEFNLSRSGDVPPIEPVERDMGEILDQAVAGKFEAIVPDSSVWLDQLDRIWRQRNPGSSALVGARTQYAQSPIVIAMWKDTAAELGYPAEPLGWDDLIRKASRDPSFRWSHSSATTALGLLTAAAEFFAGSGKQDELTKDDLRAEATRDFVRDVESTVRQYGGESEDTVVIRMLARGGSPLDAFVAEERWVVYFNRNSEEGELVAIYPEDGTLWMDHPLVLLDGSWVTPGQQRAFHEFAAFVTTTEQQRLVLREGYRPTESEISLQGEDSPIREELGADPSEPRTLLKVPSTGVLEDIRETWRLLKKPTNIYLLMDISRSMAGDKLSSAKAALISFLEQIEGNRVKVAFVPFESSVHKTEPLGPPDNASLHDRILGLKVGGGTQLHRAVVHAYDELQRKGNPEHINVIVAMTDGVTAGSTAVVETRMRVVRGRFLESYILPVLIFTIGHGGDVDFDVLQRIARLGEGEAYLSDAETIVELYELLSTLF